MEVIAASALVINFAIWCACDDATQILYNKPVRHVRQWLLRASVVTLLCVVIGLPWLAIGLAGLFSGVFRYTLNRLRGLSPWYVSPSNWYDWFWLWVGSMPGHGMYFGALLWARSNFLQQWRHYHEGWQPWISWSHNGGRIAYAVELLTFAAVLLMHVL